MNRYIGRRLDERFATRAARGKTKHVVDLALESYLKEVKGGSGTVEDVKGLDPVFKKAAISNMKTFIFAVSFKEQQKPSSPRLRRRHLTRTCRPLLAVN